MKDIAMTPLDRLRALFARDLGERKDAAARGEWLASVLALAEAAPCAVLVSQDGVVKYANRAAGAVTGLRPDALLGRPLLELLHPDFRAGMAERAAARRRGEPVPARFEVKLAGRPGLEAWADASEATVEFEGRPADVFMAYDVTDRKLADDAVRESERRLRDLIESVQLVALLIDAEGVVTFANTFLLELIGSEEEDVVGRNWFESFVPAERREALKTAFFERMRRGVMAPQDEYEIVTAKDERRWISWNNTLLHDPLGDVSGAAFLGSDVTERRRAEERLLHDALHDPLTGLPNRFLFMDRVAAAVGRLQRRPDYLFGVVLLDVDRFKVINDSLGHAAGDELLTQMGLLFASIVRRPEHTLARLGGDEFGVLLDDIDDLRDAVRVIERIDAALGRPFTVGGQDLFVRVSAGIAFCAPGYERAEDVLRDADTALYKAKLDGRARHQVFDASMHERVIHELRVEHSLRRAVERGELTLHYQPIVALADGRIAGFEALVRWQHPERGLIAPHEFIPVAEETGLIFAIGRWTLREACRALKSWELLLPPGLQVNVNLSGREFSQPDLAAQIEAAMRDAGLPPSRLKLEITESVIMRDPEAAVATLVRLKDLGPGLCIDDFGTGYSSLSYLLRFPADTLKIDQSFIAAIGQHGRQDRIVEAVVSMASSLGMTVVAEGVETVEQRDALRAFGCSYGQGFLFMRPVPAAEVEALVRHGRLDPRPEPQ
jgi:diguanylate cyclase (GGDEF)-like protein/PAS domain S-box-containing protein